MTPQILDKPTSEAPAFSIIIPHYNTSGLLQRLLDTIPSRDDTEIIVVDDASRQDELKAVRQCCGNRTRQARLLCRDTNGGGGAARNDAMRAARGRWLMFADADDYFLPSLGTVLDRYACNETYDAMFFPPIGKGSHKSTADKVAELCMKWKSDPQKYDNRMRYGIVGPWSKMVKRQFAQEQGLYFYSTRKQNDFPFNIMLGKNLKHFTVDETPIYCWDRINTSTSDRYDLQACRDSLWVYAQAIHYLNDMDTEHFKRIYIHSLCKYILMHPTLIIEGLEELQQMGCPPERACSLITDICMKENATLLKYIMISTPSERLKAECVKALTRANNPDSAGH